MQLQQNGDGDQAIYNDEDEEDQLVDDARDPEDSEDL